MTEVESLLESLIAEIQGLRSDIRELKGFGDANLSDIRDIIQEQGSTLNEIRFELESGLGFGPTGIAQQIGGRSRTTLDDLHMALAHIAAAIEVK